MTCIVGYIEKGKVYIGGDSAGSAGSLLTIRKDPKVFKVGSRFVLGFTSSFRMGQLLMSTKFNPPEQLPSQSDYQYMITSFIDSVIALFRDNGYMQKKNEEISGGTFLVAYKGRLYEVEADFQVGENDEAFSCVGCGYNTAKGAMYVLQHDESLSPAEKITKALDAASRFSGWVAPPYTIIESE